MNKIKELRIEQKITQTKLCKVLNIAQPTLSGYENNLSEPDFDTITKIANYFGCTIDYLVGRTKEDNVIYFAQNQLSQDETKLVDKLRCLKNEDKDLIYKLIETILNSYK